VIGTILLFTALVLSFGIIVFSGRRNIYKWILFGQFITTAGACLFLLYAIFAGRYDISYVFHNVSNSMPWFYKFTALWAGDSGSLLLWILVTIAISLYLFHNKNTKKTTVITFVAFEIMIFASLLFSNPFSPTSGNYINGQGINFLLENFWMISHPPVMFISYALSGVPFALTVTFLWNGLSDKDNWLKSIRVWLLAAWALLGLGIALGAIWAYEVIGWGGYWGWDPVENASLIPWLFLTVAVHALYVDKRQKNNTLVVVLSVFAAFLSVIVAVFITRSGLLSDMSVHSFAKNPMGIVIGVFFVLFLAVSVYLVLKNRKELGNRESTSDILTKPAIIGIGNIATSIFAIVLLVATFWPTLSGLFGTKQVLSSTLYSTLVTPIALILCFGTAVSPIISWVKEDIRQIVKRAIPPLFIAIIAAWVAIEFGMSDLVFALLLFATVFSTSANISQLFKLPYKKWGSSIAHIGLALLVFGVAASSIYQESWQLNIRENSQPKIVNSESSISLVDFTIDEKTADYTANLEITNANQNKISFELIGRMDRSGTWIATPYLVKSLAQDTIISPGRPDTGIVFFASPGEEVNMNGYSLTLDELHQNTAFIRLVNDDKTYNIEFPSENMDNPDFFEIEKNFTLYLEEIDDEHIKVRLTDLRKGPNGTTMLPIVYTVRMFVVFVWLGMLLLVFGIFLAMFDKTRHHAVEKELVETEV